MILGLCEDSLDGIALIIDLGEVFLLVVSRVGIVDKAVRGSKVAVSAVERSGNYELVVFLGIAVYRDVYLAVDTLDVGNLAVESCMVLEVIVELLPDVLCAVFPGPQIDFYEVHAGLEVEVLENVGSRDLIEVAVAEGGVRSDPDVLCKLDTVFGAEIFEGH